MKNIITSIIFMITCLIGRSVLAADCSDNGKNLSLAAGTYAQWLAECGGGKKEAPKAAAATNPSPRRATRPPRPTEAEKDLNEAAIEKRIAELEKAAESLKTRAEFWEVTWDKHYLLILILTLAVWCGVLHRKTRRLTRAVGQMGRRQPPTT